jgi:hypothetical protein
MQIRDSSAEEGVIRGWGQIPFSNAVTVSRHHSFLLCSFRGLDGRVSWGAFSRRWGGALIPRPLLPPLWGGALIPRPLLPPLREKG